jgi:hypothetical protein
MHVHTLKRKNEEREAQRLVHIKHAHMHIRKDAGPEHIRACVCA